MNREISSQYTELDKLLPSKKIQLSAGILAGGKSTRMGKNKALLKIGNQAFLQRLIAELADFEDLMISVDDPSKYRKYDGMPKEMLKDTHTDIGPIEGIYQILLHAKKEYVFICAVDMPLLKKELIFYMAEYISSDYDCYIIRDKGRLHPLCGIYSRGILPAVKDLIDSGEYALKNIYQKTAVKYIDIEMSCFSHELLYNINTTEDYKKYISPVIFCVSGLKNSGKTTLIEQLVRLLRVENRRVHVLKHDGHDFQIDHKGTDTYRFMEAGANSVGIFSTYKNAVVEKKEHTTSWEMFEKMSDCDVLIIEGMKNSDYPKIEVTRKEIGNDIVCDPKTLICIASDAENIDNKGVPVVSINDVKAVYQCIKIWFSL